MPDRRYDLSLEFTENSLDYRGRVTLHEELTRSELDLDADGLTIESVEAGGAATAFEVDRAAHRLRIRGLPSGTRTVTVVFSGKVGTENPAGLYRSPLGKSEVLTTHFEPSAARKMFPCRDRPDAKAVIVLEVVAPPGLTAISNMPAERTEIASDGRRRTRFAATPAMATYLLYLGLGPFEELEHTSHGYRVIAATAPGISAKTEFLMDVAARSLEHFSRYYRVPYPLPKLHLVAIPKFLSGAMENWGAIVAAEPFALEDERTPMLLRQTMATLVAHEVAHQWFGNLVTMRTWDDLWLNESFATFASYKARSALFPEWEAWEEFLSLQVGDAMTFDSLASTHPIHVDVTDPARATEFFDEISYGKGAAVLRMLEGYVGEEAFRAGVSLYLQEHQGGNAEAADLWGGIARTSREPIDRVMPEWILRPGFPVIRARLEGGALHFEQRRFGLRGSTSERPWPIPLSFDLDGHRHQRLMDETSFSMPAGPDARLLVGPGRTGFYRVRYEGALRDRLLESYPGLSPVDRWGVLDDAMAFFLSGEIGLSEFLEIMGRATEERNALVVTQAFETYTWLSPLARQLPSLEARYRSIFVAQSERLGFAPRPGESASDAAARERVQRARVALDPSFARDLAKQFPDVDRLDPGMTDAIYMAYAATAGPDEYAELRRRFREAPPGPTARAVAGGLAMVGRDDWLLECLGLLGTGEMQLSSWVRLGLTGLWFNPDRNGAYWTFLTERLEGSLPMMTTGAGMLALLLQYCIPYVGVTRPDAMRRWVAEHPFPESAEGAKKGLDLLDVYLRTLERSG